MITFPNAKINIGLQVTGKRPDGYHELETVFYPIRLCDALEVIEAEDNAIFLTGMKMPEDTENICARVYSLLQADFDLPPLHIHLHKAIPMGAGLGGGSADAGFLIKLLNKRFSLGMNVEDMQACARRLGADCAFFIENEPAFAKARGDEFEKIELDLSAYQIIVVKPDIHISTAEAFSNVYINNEGRQLRSNIKLDVSEWREVIVNDFERSIIKKYPVVEEIKDELYQKGAIYASMSGSGSAVFGIFEERVTLTEMEGRYLIRYC